MAYWLVSHRLRERLDAYRAAVELGYSASLGDAVRQTAEAARRAAEGEHAGARVAWAKRQSGKVHRHWKHARSVRLGHPCAYCGDPEPRCLDHVVPRCQGGPDDLWNLAAACKPCNHQKNGRTPEQWRAWRASKGLSWPPAWPVAGESVA
jgi:5-methylcytosine-specific restriction endonuclease McrA